MDVTRLVEEFAETKIFITEVVTNFDPKATFSALTLNLQTAGQYVLLKNLLKLKDLAQLEQFQLFHSQLDTLACEDIRSLETSVLKELATNVFVHISTEMWLEPKYEEIIDSPGSIQFKHGHNYILGNFELILSLTVNKVIHEIHLK